MDGEKPSKWLNVRVTATVREQVRALAQRYRRTSQAMAGTILTWFFGLPEAKQRQIIAELSDDDIRELAASIEPNREEQMPAEHRTEQGRLDLDHVVRPLESARRARTGSHRRKRAAK